MTPKHIRFIPDLEVYLQQSNRSRILSMLVLSYQKKKSSGETQKQMGERQCDQFGRKQVFARTARKHSFANKKCCCWRGWHQQTPVCLQTEEQQVLRGVEPFSLSFFLAFQQRQSGYRQPTVVGGWPRPTDLQSASVARIRPLHSGTLLYTPLEHCFRRPNRLNWVKRYGKHRKPGWNGWCGVLFCLLFAHLLLDQIPPVSRMNGTSTSRLVGRATPHSGHIPDAKSE